MVDTCTARASLTPVMSSTACAIHKRQPQVILETADLLADGGVTDPQRATRTNQCAPFGKGRKGPQCGQGGHVSPVHMKPQLTFEKSN